MNMKLYACTVTLGTGLLFSFGSGFAQDDDESFTGSEGNRIITDQRRTEGAVPPPPTTAVETRMQIRGQIFRLDRFLSRSGAGGQDFGSSGASASGQTSGSLENQSVGEGRATSSASMQLPYVLRSNSGKAYLLMNDSAFQQDLSRFENQRVTVSGSLVERDGLSVIQSPQVLGNAAGGSFGGSSGSGFQSGAGDPEAVIGTEGGDYNFTGTGGIGNVENTFGTGGSRSGGTRGSGFSGSGTSRIGSGSDTPSGAGSEASGSDQRMESEGGSDASDLGAGDSGARFESDRDSISTRRPSTVRSFESRSGGTDVDVSAGRGSDRSFNQDLNNRSTSEDRFQTQGTRPVAVDQAGSPRWDHDFSDGFDDSMGGGATGTFRTGSSGSGTSGGQTGGGGVIQQDTSTVPNQTRGTSVPTGSAADGIPTGGTTSGSTAVSGSGAGVPTGGTTGTTETSVPTGGTTGTTESGLPTIGTTGTSGSSVPSGGTTDAGGTSGTTSSSGSGGTTGAGGSSSGSSGGTQ